jgi:hypothetical protein
MDDIERMIRQVPERRRLAEQEMEPLRTFLAEFIDQQRSELRTMLEAREAEN